MDPLRTTSTVEEKEEDEWDTDGFVIPSLGIEESPEPSYPNAPKLEPSEPHSTQAKAEDIYLGLHGAPRSQANKQQDHPNSSNRKQRFKQKLKEADRKVSGTGRENKLENLRELVGGPRNVSIGISKGSSRDWLDPHCHESQFEKRYQQ